MGRNLTDAGDERPDTTRGIHSWRLSRYHVLQLGATARVAGTLGEGLVGIARAARRRATIVVSGAQWGVSTDYIGATEGNVRFDTSDMTDLGINTYRIYGGMSRWEWQNPYATYGAPAIDQIKADPNVVNRAWWDNAMTIPPNGSDYWWRGPSGLWQGNARTMFAGPQSAGIRPVLTLRNRDNNGNPAWAPNPPVTADDWNVWWGHVFSTVYWLSVRNSYNVDDFEIHNEPNNATRLGRHGIPILHILPVHSRRHHLCLQHIPARTLVFHVRARDLRQLGPGERCPPAGPAVLRQRRHPRLQWRWRRTP